jgi:hypothetical protein
MGTAIGAEGVQLRPLSQSVVHGDTSRNENLCTFAESRCNVLKVQPESDNELRPVQERRILHLDLADYERFR